MRSKEIPSRKKKYITPTVKAPWEMKGGGLPPNKRVWPMGATGDCTTGETATGMLCNLGNNPGCGDCNDGTAPTTLVCGNGDSAVNYCSTGDIAITKSCWTGNSANSSCNAGDAATTFCTGGGSFT